MILLCVENPSHVMLLHKNGCNMPRHVIDEVSRRISHVAVVSGGVRVTCSEAGERVGAERDGELRDQFGAEHAVEDGHSSGVHGEMSGAVRGLRGEGAGEV